MRAVLTLLLLSGAPLNAGDLVLTGATVYTAPDTPPIAGAAVLVHDGKIVAAGPRASRRIPRDTQAIDCSGKFVTAGFWNSHVHIFTPGLLHAREAKAAELSGELDAMLNRWGFTTVFDIASVLDNTLALRRRVESGEVRGPRILTVGEPLWTRPPVYVVAFLAANHLEMPAVTAPQEAAAPHQAPAPEGDDPFVSYAIYADSSESAALR